MRPSLFAAMFLLLAIAPARGEPACTYEPTSEELEWEIVEPGISYVWYQKRGTETVAPIYIHILKIDIGDDQLTLRSLRPLGYSQTIEDIVGYFKEGAVDVRAAINGDYYSFVSKEKDPLGLHASGGQLLWFPLNTSSFVIDDANRAHIERIEMSAAIAKGGKLVLQIHGANRKAAENEAILYSGYYRERTVSQRGCRVVALRRDGLQGMFNNDVELEIVRFNSSGNSFKLKPRDLSLVVCDDSEERINDWKVGDKVTLRVRTPGFESNIMEAISGGPRVLRDGLVVDEGKDEGFSMAMRFYIPKRHPRSAVGVSADGKTIYFLVGEGRIKRSQGLTGTDTACLLRAVGAADAMLFDGGGSAVMMVGGGFRNIPHKGRDWTSRALANILAVIRLKKK